MHQLDELLVGTYAAHNLRAHGPAAHVLNKILDNAEADIGLQQGAPHLLQGAFDVGFGDGGLPPEAFNRIFKTLG